MQVYGLQAYAGGRHQGWGTENWLVPVGEAYLELAAVFDDKVAESCDWGRYACSHRPPLCSPDRIGTAHYRGRRLIKAKIKEAGSKPWILVTFAVEIPEGAKAASERLGQETAPMLRIRPDGQHLTWRVGAMSKFEAAGRTPKPFFITWDDANMRPDKVCRLGCPLANCLGTVEILTPRQAGWWGG